MGIEYIAYNLASSLAHSVMIKQPLIIVEGEDDVPFYKKMITSNNKFRILPSELVLNSNNKRYTPGCEGVIDIVKDAQPIINKNTIYKQMFLGIIDSDCRKYTTEEDISYECLFKLKYYSYESHFVSEYSLKGLVSYITNVPIPDINGLALKNIVTPTQKIMNDMYYVGLEVLKGIIYSTYNRLITYDSKPEALFQKNKNLEKTIIELILEKKSELDLFAKDIGITLEDAKNIVKGKWYLYAYVFSIYESVANLKVLCNSNEIDQCPYCENGMFDKCIWKKKLTLNRSEYSNAMVNINYANEPELIYIKEKINSLGFENNLNNEDNDNISA